MRKDVTPDELSTILPTAAPMPYIRCMGGKPPNSLHLEDKIIRKIERQMNAAIRDSKDWKSANTMVTTVNGVSHVFLHGNKIAEVGDNFIVLMDGGWQSNTTKSRLNAILSEHGCGEHVFQKNFTWFLSMKNAKGEDMQIPFFSGMRLN